MKNLLKTVALLGILFSPFGVPSEEPSSSSNPTTVPEATTYQLRNQKYGDLLRPQDANSANGTRIVLYPAQPWKCMTWRLQPASESAFRVQNLFTSKTFAVDAKTESTNQPVVQVPMKKDAADIPSWQFTKLENNSYKITDTKSGKSLTGVKNPGEHQVSIVTSPWEDLDEQKWQLEKIDPKQLTM